MNRTLTLVLASAFALGCGTKDDPQSSDTQAMDDDGGSTTEFVPDPSVSDTGQQTTGMGTTTTADPDTGSTSDSFLQMPDGAGPTVECDVWEQDCPEGEKCMPWANDGSNSWNATRCSEVSENPGQVGDECTVEGSGVSGIDDCDAGMMCYYVDPETNVGTCVGFCEGTPDSPQCDSGFLCSIANNGVLILCRRECDPLLQDCQGSAACLPAAGAEGFVCIVDASGESGAPGDPCEFLNSCDPGLFCAGAAAVPNCQGSAGCCSEFCDLNEPMPDDMCTQAGQVCETWFEEGAAPPSLAHVGGCVLPA